MKFVPSSKHARNICSKKQEARWKVQEDAILPADPPLQKMEHFTAFVVQRKGRDYSKHEWNRSLKFAKKFCNPLMCSGIVNRVTRALQTLRQKTPFFKYKNQNVWLFAFFRWQTRTCGCSPRSASLSAALGQTPARRGGASCADTAWTRTRWVSGKGAVIL